MSSRDPRSGGDGRDTPPSGLPAVPRVGAGHEASFGAGPGKGSGHAGPGNGDGDGDEGSGDGGPVTESGPGGADPPGTGRRAARARRAARVRRRRRRLVLGMLVVIALIGGFVAWVEVEAHPSGAPGAAVVVDVHEGEPTGTVLAQLTRRGVIGSALAYRIWSLAHGMPTVVPGRYLLHQNASFSAVQRRLADGPNVFRLTVVPGMTLAEIDAQLASLPNNLSETFTAELHRGSVRSPYAPAPGGSLEGLIGTGSYQIMPGESAHQLVAKMVARFDAEARSAGLEPSSTVGGLSAYQVVTAASIVQKEGYFPRYFGRVARVIYNRLAQGMDLEMTSTVLYSLGQDGGPVTPAEEKITTPYNTYLHPGLTPTPICTPSAGALAAATSPPAGAWMYFDLVTAKKGVMVFSATYTGQQAAEQRAAQQKGAQGGTGKS